MAPASPGRDLEDKDLQNTALFEQLKEKLGKWFEKYYNKYAVRAKSDTLIIPKHSEVFCSEAAPLLIKGRKTLKRHVRHFSWSITTCPASHSTRCPLRQGYGRAAMAQEGTGRAGHPHSGEEHPGAMMGTEAGH